MRQEVYRGMHRRTHACLAAAQDAGSVNTLISDALLPQAVAGFSTL
jgi:hypothetical protein